MSKLDEWADRERAEFLVHLRNSLRHVDGTPMSEEDVADLNACETYEEWQARVDARRQRPAPHVCHAIDCTVPVPPRMLMCRRHWRMVPRDVQALVWAEYRPGQEIRKDPTRAYLTAANRAIDAVAAIEGRGVTTDLFKKQ